MTAIRAISCDLVDRIPSTATIHEITRNKSHENCANSKDSFLIHEIRRHRSALQGAAPLKDSSTPENRIRKLGGEIKKATRFSGVLVLLRVFLRITPKTIHEATRSGFVRAISCGFVDRFACKPTSQKRTEIQVPCGFTGRSITMARFKSLS